MERDSTGQIVRQKMAKGAGAFRPMSASQLATRVAKATSTTSSEPTLNKLFEPPTLNPLNLPLFEPKPKAIKEMVGSAAAFDLPENDPLRIFGLPKKMLLEFRILSKPCSVVRQVTSDAIDMLDDAKTKSSLESRVVLTGRPGNGKSFLLLQAVEYCIDSGWIVIYIPRAKNLVNSTTAYAYDLRTQTYLQPAFAYQTLQRMHTVNAHLLGQLQMQNDLVLEKQTVPTGTTISDLIQVAIKEKSKVHSPVILDTVMKELETQTLTPVLFAVDDFQALYCKTEYRDPHFAPIKSFHLSMPRLIMDFASGKRSFAKGALLGAITASETKYALPIELRDTLGLGYHHAMSPYHKRSEELLAYAEGLTAFPVPDKLTVAEAASLFEIWKDDMAVNSNTYDELFLSKYVESDGNARDFVWKGLLSNMSA